MLHKSPMDWLFFFYRFHFFFGKRPHSQVQWALCRFAPYKLNTRCHNLNCVNSHWQCWIGSSSAEYISMPKVDEKKLDLLHWRLWSQLRSFGLRCLCILKWPHGKTNHAIGYREVFCPLALLSLPIRGYFRFLGNSLTSTTAKHLRLPSSKQEFFWIPKMRSEFQKSLWRIAMSPSQVLFKMSGFLPEIGIYFHLSLTIFPSLNPHLTSYGLQI